MEELEQWTREGLLTAEQAAQIRRRYDVTTPVGSRALLVFTALGATVLGLGIILLLAYNWSALPKFVKLALIFGGVLGAHGAGLALRKGEGSRAALAEVFSLLGTMLFGAGIWLFAQIYHINEHFPTGFLMWGLGAMGLAWALPSTLQGLVAAIALGIWGGSEAVAFVPSVGAPFLLLGGLGPLAWRQRSALLTAVVLAAATFLVPANTIRWGDSGAVFLTVLSSTTLLITLSRGREQADERAVGRVLAFFGTTGFLLVAFFGSFPFVEELKVEVDTPGDRMAAYSALALPFVLLLAVWAQRWRTGRTGLAQPDDWICVACVVVAYAVLLFGPGLRPLLPYVFDVALLLIAIGWIVAGARTERVSRTILGSLLLSAVVFARYFDLFESLWVRGLAFVLLGAALFAQGLYIRKLRTTRRVEEERA